MITNKNILLIDDDPVTNLVNKKIIERHFDFRTIVFTDAVLALEELKKWLIIKTPLPKMIFLDIDMPEMSGWEFLDELHKLPPNYIQQCRVIVLTSSIDSEDIEKSKSYQAVLDFISKPLTTEKLRSII